MRRIDFLLSNDRHHLAMTLPVLEALRSAGSFGCRALSLCELRGLATPGPTLEAAGAEVVRLFPRRLRASPAAGGGRPGGPSRMTGLLRAAAWGLLVRPRLERAWRRPPDLCVVPNDVAFPYDRLTDVMHARSLPFLLVQEGIRFPLPAEGGERRYGQGGAAAIAVWGELSREHFLGLGVPPGRLHVTGNPRFEPAPAGRAPAGGRRLLLATNPIDDQGFCSRREKLELVARFVAALAPALDAGLSVTLKLHARESAAEYRRALGPLADRLALATDEPLAELFEHHDAAVVLASTVGVEALRAGLPLGVLEIPGHGFAWEYVAAGAAQPLAWDGEPMASQIEQLLSHGGERADAARRFLLRVLAPEPDPAGKIADLIGRLVDELE